MPAHVKLPFVSKHPVSAPSPKPARACAPVLCSRKNKEESPPKDQTYFKRSCERGPGSQGEGDGKIWVFAVRIAGGRIEKNEMLGKRPSHGALICCEVRR